MRKSSLLLFLLFVFLTGRSQNLVPNYSFEQYDTCPNNEDQIHYAIGWSKYSSAGTTPDYYNSCSPSTSFGVPYSIFTHQDDPRFCNAYAGLITFATPLPNYREFIGVQLNQSLIIGQQYFISFYTVMSEYALSGTQYGMPSNNIGIRLSTIPYDSNNPCPIDNFSQVHAISIINDSTNWNRISGSIIADSAYNYLIIGNFFSDVNTDTLHYNCGSCLNYGSYYLIDEICVSTDSSLCNGGLDELPCITAINETSILDRVSLFPNPTSDFVTILFRNDQNIEVLILDIFGRRILSDKIRNKSKVEIDISLLPPGPYFIRLVGEQTVTKKIIKL